MAPHHIEVVIHDGRAHTCKTTTVREKENKNGATILSHIWVFPYVNKLTCAWLVHRPTRGPLVLMGVVPFDAGQVRHSVVAAHDENEAEHDADAKVDPLICHGGYHFPGILAGIVSLHAADTAERTRSSGCSCSFNFFNIQIHSVTTDVASVSPFTAGSKKTE